MRQAWVLMLAMCGGSPAAITVAPARLPSPSASTTAPPTGSIVRVHFEGLKELKESDFTSVVEIDKPKKNGGYTNRDVLERDQLLLQAALFDYGYLQSKVADPPRVEIGPDGRIDVTFRVEEGPRFRLTKIALEDIDDATKKPLPPLASVKYAKAGEWFSRGAIVRDIQAIQTKYRDAGYANVDVTPETNLDPDAHTIELKIPIHRGPIVSFRTITVDPAQATIAADAARRAGVTTGTRYSETKLEQIKEDLTSRGVRADIVTREVPGTPDLIDVTIEVH